MKHYAEYDQQEGPVPRYETASERHLVSFSVSALPVPQPRQRHRVIQAGGRAYATNYTPAKHPVNGFKAAVALEAKQAWKESPLDGPLEVRLRLRFPVPASAKASFRRQVSEGTVLVPHITKPDLDNACKAIFDALTGVIWQDDKQIARLTVDKVYGVAPGVAVWVGGWTETAVRTANERRLNG